LIVSKAASIVEIQMAYWPTSLSHGLPSPKLRLYICPYRSPKTGSHSRSLISV
jgi:hypothetical protein